MKCSVHLTITCWDIGGVSPHPAVVEYMSKGIHTEKWIKCCKPLNLMVVCRNSRDISPERSRRRDREVPMERTHTYTCTTSARTNTHVQQEEEQTHALQVGNPTRRTVHT